MRAARLRADPLAADADIAAASGAGIHRLRSYGRFGRLWVRYPGLTFQTEVHDRGGGLSVRVSFLPAASPKCDPVTGS
jgi:hypothetical protein